MSRSFKHSEFVKDKADKYMKRYANKKVRHTKNIPSGGAYKKVFCSYDISDYRYLWTRKEAIRIYNMAKAKQIYGYSYIVEHFNTLEEYLKYWEKCVKRK